MHVEDTTSKEQMRREIILWASEVKNTSFLATFNNNPYICNRNLKQYRYG